MKMRKLVVVAFFVAAGMAGGGYAHEMPAKVQEFLDNYTKDSTVARWGGALYLRKKGIIPDSVPIKDLRLKVLQEHWFRGDISFNDYPDTVALSELIEPGYLWRILIMAHGEPLYELQLSSKTGEPRIQRSNIATRRHLIWGPLLKAYPEPTDIKPILIVHSELPISYPFLYFEQFGPRKIYYAGTQRFNPKLVSLFTASIDTLDDSRKLVKYLKEYEIYKANEQERMKLEKTKDTDGNENNRPAEFGAPAFDLDGQLHKDGFVPTGGR
jgi:hypothetical protein